MPARRASAPDLETTDDAALFLSALRRLAKATGDREWLLQQNARDLAHLHSALFGGMFALLPSVGYDLTGCTPIERTPAERGAIHETVQRLDVGAPPRESASMGRLRREVQKSPVMRAMVETLVQGLTEDAPPSADDTR